jgi:hypothetical protein
MRSTRGVLRDRQVLGQFHYIVRAGHLLDQQILECLQIYLRQHLKLSEPDALVDFVDGRVGRTALDDLRANVGDEAPV